MKTKQSRNQSVDFNEIFNQTRASSLLSHHRLGKDKRLSCMMLHTCRNLQVQIAYCAASFSMLGQPQLVKLVYKDLPLLAEVLKRK